MVNVFTYWDSVLVCDNCFPESVYSKAVIALNHNLGMTEGEVGGANKEDTKYRFTAGLDLNFLADNLIERGLIPTLPDHGIEKQIRHHVMLEGGKMAWHCDSGYSIAATAYFSSCDGGELQIESPCGTQSILINPQPNRVVVIKCDNMHRVAEVFGGKRESIQIFYTFIERSENGYLGNH